MPALLACELAGGLTNQENQVGNCIQLASTLERDLVPPRPRVFLENSAAVPVLDDGNGGSLPYHRLWDLQHLRSCARKRYGVHVATDALSTQSSRHTEGMELSLMWSRGDPNVNWTFTHVSYVTRDPRKGAHTASAGSRSPHTKHILSTVSITKPTAGMLLPEHGRAAAQAVLRERVPRAIPMVVAREPFYALSSRITPNDTCAVPSAAIRARIDTIRATLGNYACLHARLEEDWFNYCCVRGSLQRGKVTAASEMEMKRALNAHSSTYANWTKSGGPGVPPACGVRNGHSMHAPPRHCFASADQIARVMLRTVSVARRSTVYVATGVRDDLLEPIAAHFHVARRPSSTAKDAPLLSYEDALVDRGVCERAPLGFFGHELSTFSMLIDQMRSSRGGMVPTVWWNKEI
ncbi:hypothetical protein AB1Y20_013901 [Prymnesium parvum]|uniref:O-fucosyltransferase family protein n=1 Tax=Prymnesium parvum TaxID=97485 RepID=A0AB34IGT4_PRYPA